MLCKSLKQQQFKAEAVLHFLEDRKPPKAEDIRKCRELSKQHHKVGTKHLKYDFMGDISNSRHSTGERCMRAV